MKKAKNHKWQPQDAGQNSRVEALLGNDDCRVAGGDEGVRPGVHRRHLPARQHQRSGQGSSVPANAAGHASAWGPRRSPSRSRSDC